MTPMEAYVQINRILESVNAFTSTLLVGDVMQQKSQQADTGVQLTL